MSDQVSSSRFIWGIVAGVGISLLLLAVFLLGRASKDDAPAPPAAQATSEPEPYEEPGSAPLPAERAPRERLLSKRLDSPGESTNTVSPSGSGARQGGFDSPDDPAFRALGSSGGAPSTGLRRDPRQDQRIWGDQPSGGGGGSSEVARYLDDAERVMAGGKFWADDEAFAQSLLTATMTGNNKELERLVDSLRGVREELKGLTPPLDASAYHRETLGVLDSGITMLEKLSEAIVSQDPTAMMMFPAMAEDLTRRAERVDAMGKTLRGE